MCSQSYPTLCNPMDCSPPGSSVQGILQARILEWVAMPSSRDLPNTGIERASLVSPVLAGGFFTTSRGRERGAGALETWDEPPFAASSYPCGSTGDS